MKVRDLLGMLRKDGWTLARVRGSHHQFTHPVKPGVVTVAYDRESEDIPVPIRKSIFRQAGWLT
jgi:predicted RNA binding protein YcfA (HicA-like mRNA interferase family)